MNVFDADVHLHEAPADLAPYCEMPWRRALEGETGDERWLDTPGYSPLTPLDPLIGDFPGPAPHFVTSAEAMRADLDARGVDAALLITDRFVGLAGSHDRDYAVAISGAYNRYLRDRWIDPGRGLHGAVLRPGQDPDAAAGELRAYAGIPGVAAGLLSLVNAMPFYGDRFYDPIYAAASETGLPIVFHGATIYGDVFPYQLHHYDTATARAALAQPLGALAHLTSLVMGGALARHPGLKIVFCESGLGWLPFLSARLDGQRGFVPQEAPEVVEAPSSYVRRQVWLTSHPTAGEGTQLPALVEAIGADRVLFASDWPHYDHDHVTSLAAVPEPTRARLLAENARALFRLS